MHHLTDLSTNRETAAQENSSAYFPLLDRIAEGVFEDVTTEKDLYESFLKVLEDGKHLQDEDSLDSFKFALAIRSAAPRIEAHYQYYNTSVQTTLGTAQDAACPIWVHMDGKQYCSITLERAQQDVSGDRLVYPTCEFSVSPILALCEEVVIKLMILF